MTDLPRLSSHADHQDVAVLRTLFGVARRQWLVVLLCVLAALALGGLWAVMQAPVYRSAATIMVRSGPAIAADFSRPVTITPEEEGLFLSQLEVIRSASVAKAVADRLNLANDASFAAPASSGIRKLLAVAGIDGEVGKGDNAKPDPMTPEAIIAALRANVSVSRQGRTYVASIAYQDDNPKMAANIAQGFAEAYRDQLAAEHAAGTEALKTHFSSRLKELDAEIAALRATLTDPQAPDHAARSLAMLDRNNERARVADAFNTALANRALPSMDVAILTNATPSAAPIAPRKGFILVVAAIVGLAIGAVLAGLRNMADRGLHTGRDVEAAGFAFLGHAGRRTGPQKQSRPVASRPIRLDGPARLALDDPGSALAQALGTIQVAASHGERKVIGITSPSGGEGKSHLAANLASWLAGQGRRVLLVDGDWHRAALSKWLVPEADKGIVDMMTTGISQTEAETIDPSTSLVMLARGAGGKVVEPTGLWLSDHARTIIDQARGNHDIIIIDLPALDRPDALAASRLVDGYVVVARWGQTRGEDLADAVRRAGLASKIIGVLLNRTPLNRVALYDA